MFILVLFHLCCCHAIKTNKSKALVPIERASFPINGHQMLFLNFNDYYRFQHPFPINARQCSHEMELPCTIRETGYVRADSSVSVGTFGSVFRAHEVLSDGVINTDIQYMVKFAKNANYGKYPDLCSEDYVTTNLYHEIAGRYRSDLARNWWQWFRPEDMQINWVPTIRVYESESFTPNIVGYPFHHIVLIIDCHELGDVERISGRTLMHFKQNPAGFVWKFLVDQAYVLEAMNSKFRWIDNDEKLRNVVVAGDTRNYKTTSFIKVCSSDYQFI